jgi:hypothetical protein
MKETEKMKAEDAKIRQKREQMTREWFSFRRMTDLEN